MKVQNKICERKCGKRRKICGSVAQKWKERDKTRKKPVVKKRKGREMKEACLQHRAVTDAEK